MDYPNSDEEFELMYGDELELLRQNEEDIEIHELPPKSRRSLDFASQTKQAPVESNLPDQQNAPILVSQTVLPNSSISLDSEFQSLDHTTALPSTSTTNLQQHTRTKKRSVQELFGEIDDISDEEDQSRVKKHKSSRNDDLILIEHILELRKLAKERQNSVVLSNKDYATASKDHNKYNLSYQVPKYSFVTVTRHGGERVYVRCHSEKYEKEEIQNITKKTNFGGVMGQTFKDIWKKAEEYMNRNLDVESEPALENVTTNAADLSILKQSSESNSNLWVDLYKPQKYLELLSDESTNRTLLRWLKLWDKVVFNRKPKPKIIKTDSKMLNNNKFRKPELTMNLDAHGRPEHKIVLLCGPPGLGKTTLAHMVAKHAGYNVVEVNASDDRSTEKFKTVLENATQMRSVIDKENRPNCLVFDEIDGAPSASIEFLIKFVNGTATTSKKKKGAKQTANILKRPIICICNDVYVPALRPLRQIAFVVNFPPTASARLADRLNEIARHQSIKTDLGALLALCEKSGNDIRSCLSVLHFFKSLSKPITLSQVYKTSIGQKDIQKGLFAVWQEIFQIQRSKHEMMSPVGDDNNQDNMRQNDSSLKNRMQKILHTVNAFGDYERLAQGVFENYPIMNVTDSSLLSTCRALDWFCFTDVLNKQIYSLQNYTLLSYLPYSFVIWHYVFASLAKPKLTYPSVGYEVRTDRATNCIPSTSTELMDTSATSGGMRSKSFVACCLYLCFQVRTDRATKCWQHGNIGRHEIKEFYCMLLVFVFFISIGQHHPVCTVLATSVFKVLKVSSVIALLFTSSRKTHQKHEDDGFSSPEHNEEDELQEAKVKASRNTALLAEVMKGMQPTVRAFTYSNSLRLDTLPILSQIIMPLFRPVNLHLYTPQEKEQLLNVVSVMIDYNLNYVQERTPEGNYVFNIDPNIDEITTFTGTKPKRFLSYSNKQLIAREIEMEKMRRTEIHKIGDRSTIDSNKMKTNNESKENEKQLPNHLQRLKPKVVKPKGDTVVTKDFFGRIVAKPSTAGKVGLELKNDIWYQYKEGYNNAVRKRIKISSLL